MKNYLKLFIIMLILMIPLISFADNKQIQCLQCGLNNDSFMNFCARCATKLTTDSGAEKILKTKEYMLVNPYKKPPVPPEPAILSIRLKYSGKFYWMNNNCSIFVNGIFYGKANLVSEKKHRISHSDPFRFRKYIFYGKIPAGKNLIEVKMDYFYYLEYRGDKTKKYSTNIVEFTDINCKTGDLKSLRKDIMLNME